MLETFFYKTFFKFPPNQNWVLSSPLQPLSDCHFTLHFPSLGHWQSIRVPELNLFWEAKAQKHHTETAWNSDDSYFNSYFTIQVLNVVVSTYSKTLHLKSQTFKHGKQHSSRLAESAHLFLGKGVGCLQESGKIQLTQLLKSCFWRWRMFHVAKYRTFS